ncbi:hypothetical protein ABVK25_000820 [Lepraria finkii]|uniref:Uncharacterized protein n=1 Tax=Lepraria finkii TaxID=1340010 RepID=A0ABR4BNZ1_9LECA
MRDGDGNSDSPPTARRAQSTRGELSPPTNRPNTTPPSPPPQPLPVWLALLPQTPTPRQHPPTALALPAFPLFDPSISRNLPPRSHHNHPFPPPPSPLRHSYQALQPMRLQMLYLIIG